MKNNKVPLSVRVDEKIKNKFIEISKNTRKTQSELLTEAMDLLFNHYDNTSLSGVFNPNSDANINYADLEFLKLIEISIENISDSQFFDYLGFLEDVIDQYEKVKGDFTVKHDDNKILNTKIKIESLNEFDAIIRGGRSYSADLKRKELKESFNILNIISNNLNKALQYILAFNDLKEISNFDTVVDKIYNINDLLDDILYEDYSFLSDDYISIIKFVKSDLNKIMEIDYESLSSPLNNFTIPTNVVDLKIDGYNLREILENDVQNLIQDLATPNTRIKKDDYNQKIKTIYFKNQPTNSIFNKLLYNSENEDMNSNLSVDDILEKIEKLERKNEELTKKYRELNIRIDKLQHFPNEKAHHL